MPFTDTHPAFIVPETNLSLWKYMDIPSFLSLLVEESLTFTRANLFDDRFEGKYPKLAATLIDEEASKLIAKHTPTADIGKISEQINKLNTQIYLNCWCNESHEMFHMWKIYSKENGVAIETNYESLKKSIRQTDNAIFPTLVKYIDFDKEIGEMGNNLLTLYTQKRKQYKSENEFRLVMPWPKDIESKVADIPDHDQKEARKQLYQSNTVMKCKVDVNTLIKQIHISPYAPKWYTPLITDLAHRYGLTGSSIFESDL